MSASFAEPHLVANEPTNCTYLNELVRIVQDPLVDLARAQELGLTHLPGNEPTSNACCVTDTSPLLPASTARNILAYMEPVLVNVSDIEREYLLSKAWERATTQMNDAQVSLNMSAAKHSIEQRHGFADEICKRYIRVLDILDKNVNVINAAGYDKIHGKGALAGIVHEIRGEYNVLERCGLVPNCTVFPKRFLDATKLVRVPSFPHPMIRVSVYSNGLQKICPDPANLLLKWRLDRSLERGLFLKVKSFFISQSQYENVDCWLPYKETKLVATVQVDECIICRNSRSDARCKPCGHADYCLECIAKCNACPLCRHLLTVQDLEYKNGDSIPADVVEYLCLTNKLDSDKVPKDDVPLKKHAVEVSEIRDTAVVPTHFKPDVERNKLFVSAGTNDYLSWSQDLGVYSMHSTVQLHKVRPDDCICGAEYRPGGSKCPRKGNLGYESISIESITRHDNVETCFPSVQVFSPQDGERSYYHDSGNLYYRYSPASMQSYKERLAKRGIVLRKRVKRRSPKYPEYKTDSD